MMTSRNFLDSALFGLCLGLVVHLPGLLHREAPPLQAESEIYFSLDESFLPETPVIVDPDPSADIRRLRYVYWKTVSAKVTAYTPNVESCEHFTDGFTSIGHNAWDLKGVAADPWALPYGSMVRIPSVGFREVDDTGRAMRAHWREKGLYHLDVRFSEVDQARHWGVRELLVDIYRPESAP